MINQSKPIITVESTRAKVKRLYSLSPTDAEEILNNLGLDADDIDVLNMEELEDLNEGVRERLNELRNSKKPVNFGPYTRRFLKQQKEHKMLSITNPTMLNGRVSETHSDKDLIVFIEQTEKSIKRLKKLKVKSKKIDGYIDQHRDNLKKLAAILDSRE